MKRHLYLSEENEHFNPTITNKCFNPIQLDMAITGFVCHSRGRLLFYMEGPTAEVDTYLDLLKADQHLHYIFMLDISRPGDRLLDSWQSKQISMDKSRHFHYEHYVEQYLLYIKNGVSSKQQNLKFIWSNLISISKKNNRLLSIS